LSGRKRIARLNEQLKREISELIRIQVRDPRVGLVTITGVDVARDLGSAKVYIRSQGTPAEVESTLEGLGAAAPFLRTTLGRILSVRRVPELRFRTDRSYEHAQRIEQVLSEVMPPEGSLGESSEAAPEAAPEPDGESE
jgi:ribosome-binding factor A